MAVTKNLKFLIQSQPICQPGPLLCPAVAVAARGDADMAGGLIFLFFLFLFPLPFPFPVSPSLSFSLSPFPVSFSFPFLFSCFLLLFPFPFSFFLHVQWKNSFTTLPCRSCVSTRTPRSLQVLKDPDNLCQNAFFDTLLPHFIHRADPWPA